MVALLDQNSSTVGSQGLIRVQSNAQMLSEERKLAEEREKQARPQVTDMAAHILSVWQENKTFKETNGVDRSMLESLRMRDGSYDSLKLAQIQALGGSEVFISLTSVKCRAAEAWLTDVLGSVGEKPWRLAPTPVPEMPPSVEESIIDRVMAEWQARIENGEEPQDTTAVFEAAAELRDKIEDLISYEAGKRALKMETKISDMLVEGEWSSVFDDVITDLVTLKAGIMKCPVVREKKKLEWGRNSAGWTVVRANKEMVLECERVDPFKFFPAPGMVGIDDGDIIEVVDFTRKSLSAMRDVEGYDSKAIALALNDYAGGRLVHYTQSDEERAAVQLRGYRVERFKHTIQGLEYWGSVQGKFLIERAIYKDGSGRRIDPISEYEVNCILVGSYVIYAQLNPDPLGRRPYSKAVWSKIPGSFWGKGVPELMKDLQGICNASVRSLINNLGWSSGPQASIDDMDRVPPGEDVTSIFPGKIWQFINPMQSQRKPVEFWQVASNAGELMAVYDKFSQLADDFTGIPAYSYGNDNVAGAGRTASGLAMLMTSAARGIKKVILGVHRDIIKPAITRYFEHIMQYEEDESLKGDVQIQAVGALSMIMEQQLAEQRMNFLNATANPVDLQIIGMERRGNILRKAAAALDMPVEDVVPPQHELKALAEEMKRQQQQQAIAMEQGAPLAA